jgi:hypothetical protein
MNKILHTQYSPATLEEEEIDKGIKIENIPEEGKAQEKKRFFLFPLFHWKAFFVFLACISLVIVHWIFTSDLFLIPKDIESSRKKFFVARERYEKNKDYWDAKQAHFIATVREEIARGGDEKVWHQLQNASTEILISFLIKELEVNPQNMVAIARKKESPSFGVILSKYDKSVWPLHILLSLELEFKIKNGHFAIDFARLRRGSQDISIGLSWAYFGPELEPLKKLELFSLPSSPHALQIVPHSQSHHESCGHPSCSRQFCLYTHPHNPANFAQ